MRWKQEVDVSRWIEITATTPSGKALFVCRFCGRTSPIPDKGCGQPPMYYGKPFEMTCEQLQEDRRDHLVHPVHRSALRRVGSLLKQLLKLKSEKARIELLRSDRLMVLSMARHSIMRRGAEATLRIWDVFDDLEAVKQEVEKK